MLDVVSLNHVSPNYAAQAMQAIQAYAQKTKNVRKTWITDCLDESILVLMSVGTQNMQLVDLCYGTLGFAVSVANVWGKPKALRKSKEIKPILGMCETALYVQSCYISKEMALSIADALEIAREHIFIPAPSYAFVQAMTRAIVIPPSPKNNANTPLVCRS